MLSYIVEYKGRNILVQTDSKENFKLNIVSEFEKKNIDIKIENITLNLLNHDINIYYEIESSQLPDQTVLVKVFDLSLLNDQVSVLGPPTTAPVNFSLSCDNSRPGPSRSIERSSTNTAPLSSEQSTWPNIFKIKEEKMSLSLKKALNRGDLLNRKELSNLLDFLYQQITNYTYYPTPSNYEEVTSSLLCKYPHLLEGCKFGDAKEQWRVRLSAKARNTRQRHDKNVLVVSQKRQKLNSSVVASGETTKKKSTPAFGSPNYLPSKPDHEDEDSLLRHIGLLKGEMKKSSIDSRKIDLSMKNTFYHRRHLLIKEGLSLMGLKDMYPVLFDSMQIMYEFIRITEVDIQTSLHVRLTEYSDSLLKVAGIIFEEQEGNHEITDIKTCLAAKQIPKLLKDSVNFNKKSENASPMLFFEGDVSDPNSQGSLFAEGIELCKFQGIITGLSVWLASYYVFDCSYPPSCCRTLRFLQREILGIKDKTKVSLICSTLIQKLNILKQQVHAG